MNTWPHTNPQQLHQPPATSALAAPADPSTSRAASVQQWTEHPEQQRQRREGVTSSHLPARGASQHNHQYQRYQPYLHHQHHQQQQYQNRHQQVVSQDQQFAHSEPGPSNSSYPYARPQYYRQYQGPAYDDSLAQQQPSSSSSSSGNNSFVPNYQYLQCYQQCQASAPHQQCHFEGYQQPSYQHYQPTPPPQDQLSTLEGVQSGVPTLTTPTLTPTTLRNIQQTFLQASASQPQPPETHSNQAGFVPPFVHPQPAYGSLYGVAGSTFISIDSKSLGGGIATLVDTSSYSSINEHSDALSKTTSGPPPLLPISDILTTSSAHLSGHSIPTIITTAPPSTSPMPSVSLSVYSSDSDTLSLDAPPSRRMGGRRPNNHQKLSEEEEAKRHVRRERNKMAAARCRKRRLDQTMTLQEETDHLSEKRSALQQEVTMLTQQKEELEFLLATHKAACTKPVRARVLPPPASSVIVTSSVRMGAHTTVNSSAPPVTEAMFIGSDKSYMTPGAAHTAATHVRVKEENVSDSEDQYSNSLFSSIIPTSSSLSHVVTYSSAMPPSTLGSMRSQAGGRPNRPTSLNVAPLNELGVSIETPSAGLRGFNFESMMDGGTGLTPVTPLPGMLPTPLTTGLTPLTTPIMPHPSVSSSNNNNNSSGQCGYQQRSSSSELSSPDSMSSKQLVSL